MITLSASKGRRNGKAYYKNFEARELNLDELAALVSQHLRPGLRAGRRGLQRHLVGPRRRHHALTGGGMEGGAQCLRINATPRISRQLREGMRRGVIVDDHERLRCGCRCRVAA